VNPELVAAKEKLVVLFLGACLVVGLSVKTKIRHPRIVAHTLAIIGLAAVLWRF
jgi:hypothetical protein